MVNEVHFSITIDITNHKFELLFDYIYTMPHHEVVVMKVMFTLMKQQKSVFCSFTFYYYYYYL